jgi:hypothetical protein
MPDRAKSTRATLRIWTPGAVDCASDSVAEHKANSGNTTTAKKSRKNVANDNEAG